MNVKPNKNESKGVAPATARLWHFAHFVLLFGFSIDVGADCPSPLPPSGISDDVREFYADMCRESDSPMVIASDPSVKARLQSPSGGRRLIEDEIYPEKARRLSFEGSVVAALMVELDGTVSHSKIIASSGHRSLDDAVWGFRNAYKFDSPGLLDGAPTRTIVVERVNFKLKPGPGLPPSFSDWAVDNLALRILQPYNSKNANALFQGVDDIAKSNITLDKVQERFTRYGKQFGGMRYFEYKGLVAVKNVGGVLRYQLAYLIGTAIPQAGAAVWTVTAVDRQPLPGIIDFDFKPSPIRLSSH